MAQNLLTATQVAKLVKGGAKPGLHADGGNLYLSVGKGAARSWVVRIKVGGAGGRIKDIGLGSVSDVGLAVAREKAREDEAACGEWW